jgi:hypothetical protein
MHFLFINLQYSTYRYGTGTVALRYAEGDIILVCLSRLRCRESLSIYSNDKAWQGQVAKVSLSTVV